MNIFMEIGLLIFIAVNLTKHFDKQRRIPEPVYFIAYVADTVLLTVGLAVFGFSNFRCLN